jgi:hypothetical protein
MSGTGFSTTPLPVINRPLSNTAYAHHAHHVHRAANVSLDLNVAWEQLKAFFGGNSFNGADPEDFTQRVAEHFNSLGYNVMVIWDQSNLADGEFAKQNFQLQTSFLGTTKGFDVYISPPGLSFTVTNTGDGGYSNWCMMGNFERTGESGRTVHFS